MNLSVLPLRDGCFWQRLQGPNLTGTTIMYDNILDCIVHGVFSDSLSPTNTLLDISSFSTYTDNADCYPQLSRNPSNSLPLHDIDLGIVSSFLLDSARDRMTLDLRELVG